MKMIMKNEKQEQIIEKVQGRAMLRWDGKKPLERIEYFPAQEKEVYGDKDAKEFNKLFWGDNLQVLAHLLKEHRGKIDLIYIDPPFDSGADYIKTVKVRGEKMQGAQYGLLEEVQYKDIWENDQYLQFMYERLMLMKELLSENGSIYLHMDSNRVHYLKVIMDEIFGEENFQREVVWRIGWISGYKSTAKNWIRNHDTILFYTKNKQCFDFNKLYIPYPSDYVRRDGNAPEGAGYPIEDTWNCSELDKLDSIQIMSFSGEKKDYPTQKNENLLERIISASSNVGGTVLDCFVGSGTTVAVAQKLGRHWIGCDINIGAIQTTTKRLNQIIESQKEGVTEKSAWLLDKDGVTEARKHSLMAFKVLNVNDYDVFKNEIEAKGIIMDAYGVERIRSGYFDGVLDNNFVKVMPINRVCSKKDVDEVLKGIKDNLGDFTAKTKSRHGESVYQQGVSVFCSGMELDMLDYLKKNNVTGVDVDVRDILLDKQTLIFKQKPEAEITIKAGDKKATVTISDFISPILMRKLEIENEKALKQESKAKVDNYRQVIDSVAIDVDYDGNLFNAEIIDVPAKNELIKGEYVLEYAKKGKTIVAIKIVDVLGEEYFESFEVTV
jgi:DNA modification methylase